jgi:hypothetical protein
MNDPEVFLTPATPPACDGTLREALRTRTTTILRRRRRLKQLGYAAALAACFAAGMAAMRYALSPALDPAPQVVRQRPGPEKAPETPPEPPAVVQAVALEWQAFDAPGGRAELFRQAGDLYVSQGYDPHAALRCYRNALDSGSADDLRISAADNWLLMALKNDRQKEKRDVPNGN